MEKETYPGNIFDDVAEDYDETRPGYPEELFDCLVAESGIPHDGRILEIGCGTGKATLSLARRGFSIFALEPGPRLAAIARRHLVAFPNVRIVETTFEGWPVEPQAFDLVASAQAFHWLDPATALPKIAKCLPSGGSVAVFWNVPSSEGFPLRAEIDQAYERHAPELAFVKGALARKVRQLGNAISTSGLFRNVVERRFPWSATYDTGRLIRLMGTYSNHQALPDERRKRLSAAIADVVNGAGGSMTLPYVAVMWLADRP